MTTEGDSAAAHELQERLSAKLAAEWPEIVREAIADALRRELPRLVREAMAEQHSAALTQGGR